MEITVTEFRKDIKKYFDAALVGNVCIERGGIHFNLVPRLPEGVIASSTRRDKEFDFCKHDAVKGFCRKGCK